MIRETTLDNGEFAVITSQDGYDQCALGSKHEELRIHINSSVRCLCRAQVRELLPYLQRFAETGRLEGPKNRTVTLRWIEDGQERTFQSSDLEKIRAQAFCLIVGQRQGIVEKIMMPEIGE